MVLFDSSSGQQAFEAQAKAMRLQEAGSRAQAKAVRLQMRLQMRLRRLRRVGRRPGDLARAKCALCVERSKIALKSRFRKGVRRWIFLPSHPKARAFARAAWAEAGRGAKSPWNRPSAMNYGWVWYDNQRSSFLDYHSLNRAHP